VIASTGKDPGTGRLVTQNYRVEGPVMLLTTTTAIDIDEELLNRCLILTVDESRAQTRAIHQAQRLARTLEGVQRKQRKIDVLAVHRNAQRLLQPLTVVNPYAPALTFLDEKTRTRRDHDHYQVLIEAITHLFQYQRPVKVLHREGGRTLRYIETTVEDIALANRLAHEVFGRCLDELPPQTRRFLDLLCEMVQEQCRQRQIDQGDYRFYQRQVRHYTGWSDYQVKTHLRKLVSLEYVLVHRGGRGQRWEYELLYRGEGRDGQPFLMGLADVEELRAMTRSAPDSEISSSQTSNYDPKWEHHNQEWEQPGSIEGASREHPGSIGKTAPSASETNGTQGNRAKNPKNAQGPLSQPPPKTVRSAGSSGGR
jgi:hypothetical protein